MLPTQTKAPNFLTAESTPEPPALLKIALVHDHFHQFGGAERVLLALAEIFPEAPIYTILYNEKTMGRYLKGRTVKTSFLNHPLISKPPRHRVLIPLLGHAAQTINLKDEYDVIISSSVGYTKGIRHSRGIHISYANCLMRHWEPEVYLSGLFPKPLIWAGMPAIKYMQWQDKLFSQKPHRLIANSGHVARKIQNFYQRESDVIYPPVDTEVFYPDPNVPKGDYYLALGRIIHFKKFPLTVSAFNQIDRPLRVVGSGSDERAMRKAARTQNISFTPEVRDDAELRRIITGARALIVPEVEDFGLVTAEAIACGTPVIGYGEGGTAEIIEDGVNGVLFNDQTEEGIIRAVERFENMQFDPQVISASAQNFSKELFQRRILDYIYSTLQEVYN